MKKSKVMALTLTGVLAASALLAGTYAWQSISQKQLNENRAAVNPGARLHDDYQGNKGIKKVYVENYTTSADGGVSILARVRLDEYMEIGESAGYKKELTTANGTTVVRDDSGTGGVFDITESVESGVVTVTLTPLPYTGNKVASVTAVQNPETTANSLNATEAGGIYTCTYTAADGPVKITVKFETDSNDDYQYRTVEQAKSVLTAGSPTLDDKDSWTPYVPGDTSKLRDYVTLTLGSEEDAYYMPTFNRNNDSLEADVNGTYAGKDGDYTTRNDAYSDYTEYKFGMSEKADEIYGDSYIKENETHWTRTIIDSKSKVITMDEWLDDPKLGDFWVYDEDGWAYWANPLPPESATGLLLSKNKLTKKMDESWYYGMNVVSQFVSQEDVGIADSTGFYENADEEPTENAEILLAMLDGNGSLAITRGEEADDGSLHLILGSADDASGTVSADNVASRAGTPTKWISTDEDVITVADAGNETATVIATGIGDAYVVYRTNDSIAAIKVSVTYEPFTITAETMQEAEDLGIVSYTDVDRKQLVITGEPTTGTGVGKHYDVTVGKKAFCQSDITDLTIGAGVSQINEEAFASCTQLTCSPTGGTLTIPGTVKELQYYCFQNSSIQNLVLEEGIVSIQSNAFGRISTLTNAEIVIPKSITDFDQGVFAATKIKDFKVSEGNTHLYVGEDQCVYSEEGTILNTYFGNETSFKIPEGVTHIRVNSFRNADGLETLYIPKSVKTIGSYAFWALYNLEVMNYGGTVAEWNQITKGTQWDYRMGSLVPGTTNWDLDTYKTICNDLHIVVSWIYLYTKVYQEQW